MIPPLDDSALALRALTLEAGTSDSVHESEHDSLVYISAGEGLLLVGGDSAPISAGSAGLVLAGEEASIQAVVQLELLVATVSREVDMHAPLGVRELVAAIDSADAQQATGARSFQILLGPHNGSTRATLFAGYVPPGTAPWHYHLYDEIVWIPDGPGRLHLRETTDELGPGSAFRLRPRQVHIVENLGGEEMTIIGIFTPAGSPSATYLEPGVAAEYRFAG